MTDSDDKLQGLLERANKQLDESVNTLDLDTQRALRLARGRAIKTLHKPRKLWQPVSVVAITAAIAMVAVSLQFRVQHVVDTPQAIEDIQILGASEELEFYEDLEFYQWLDLHGRTVEG